MADNSTESFSLNKIALEDNIHFRRPCASRGFLLCIFCRMRVKRDSSLASRRLCPVICMGSIETHDSLSDAAVWQSALCKAPRWLLSTTHCSSLCELSEQLITVCTAKRSAYKRTFCTVTILRCLETLKRPRLMHHLVQPARDLF